LTIHEPDLEVEMNELMTAHIENPNHILAETVVIRPESPLHPGLAPLWHAKTLLSRELYPAESDYSYSSAQLAAPHIYFLVAEYNGEMVGCGAAAHLGDYGEIKSMFVFEHMRGQRIGERIIAQLEEHMRRQGLTIARLETGVDSHSARRLYSRMGYTRCRPFGDYADDPLCVFMEKQL